MNHKRLIAKADNGSAVLFACVKLYAPLPDWWEGLERYDSYDDLVDVAVGPLELEHEGRTVRLDFSHALLEVVPRETFVELDVLLTDLNEYGTGVLNGGALDGVTINRIVTDPRTKVKTVRITEVLDLDLERAQFDGLELAGCKMATWRREFHRKDVSVAELHC